MTIVQEKSRWDIHDLIQFGQKYHFDVEWISIKKLIEEISVVRAKNQSMFADARSGVIQYLGYQYAFTGRSWKATTWKGVDF